MMNITDEILNKYLDGELTTKEADEVNSALSVSEEIRKRYNTLRLVHDQLLKMEVESVSADFTLKLMRKLPHKIIVPRQQKYFFAAVSFLIVIICLVIVGYVATAIFASLPEQTGSADFLESFNQFSSLFVSEIERFFKGRSLSIIGSVFSFGILISGYFFFEYQKKAKANLSR